MKRTIATIVTALGIASSVLPMPQASAHTIRPQEDRTDNVFSFSYDSSDGHMPSERSRQTSSQSVEDDVTFTVLVREAEDAGSGLIGKLKLRLNDDHRTVYNGWFTFKVVDSDGEVSFQRARPANLQLYPRPGMRRASITFRFDLPSGSYQATGSFESN